MAKTNKPAAVKNADTAAQNPADGAASNIGTDVTAGANQSNDSAAQLPGTATQQTGDAAGQSADASATSSLVGESAVQTEGLAVKAEEPPPNTPATREELAASGEHDAQQSTAAQRQIAAAQAFGTLDDEADELPEEIEGYWVRAVPKQGFRRAGISVPHEGLGFAVGVLTDEQLEALENEPNIVIQECTFTNAGPN